MKTRRRPAFSLPDLLAALALTAAVLGLALPAVVHARAAAADNKDTNNLRQLALAAVNYADGNNGALPPGVDNNNFSARVYLLPFVEKDDLYKKISLTKAIDDPANADARKTAVDVFLSPRDPLKKVKDDCGATNFLFNDQVFSLNSRTAYPAGFPDGTSNTIMVGETLKGDGGTKAKDVQRQHVALKKDDLKDLKDDAGVQPWKDNKNIAGDRCASWMDGRFLQGTFNGRLKPNDDRPDVTCDGQGGVSALRSLNDKVAVGIADGSVKLIDAKKISLTTWQAALTPAGGEVLGNDW
jgi:type II secretory pathway pseudopilin PulG